MTLCLQFSLNAGQPSNSTLTGNLVASQLGRRAASFQKITSHLRLGVMEFQAIILAGGRGSRMYPLTENIPKALLPVGNRPLIWYSVNYLETVGFPEAIVIVSKANSQLIGSVLEEFRVMDGVKMTFTLVETASEDWGTADALRAVKSKIKTDMLILSCDLVTNVPLHLLADVFRTHNSTTAILLSPESMTEQESSSKGKASHKERDIIGLNESSQLLFFCSEADLVDNLTLSRGMLKQSPHIQFHTDLLDGHLYLMKKWVLDYLTQNKNISSLKEELMPQLVKAQFQTGHMIIKPNPYTQFMDSSCMTTPAVQPESSLATMTGLASNCHDDLEQLALSMSSGGHTGMVNHVISCHAHIASSDLLCIRVNTEESYKEVNKRMPRYISSLCPSNPSTGQQQLTKGRGTVTLDSLVGEYVSMKDKVSIKHSMVHCHSVIGEKTRLLLSVVMDHVKIGDNCTIQNSIICSEAHIEDNVILKDCIVGFRCTVSCNTEAKGETFVRESEEMNL